MNVIKLIELLEKQKLSSIAVVSPDAYYYPITNLNQLILCKYNYFFETETKQYMTVYMDSDNSNDDRCLEIVAEKNEKPVVVKDLIDLLKKHEQDREVVMFSKRLYYYPVASTRTLILERIDIRDAYTNELIQGYRQSRTGTGDVACLELRS